jgi:hypothetical protein
LFRSKTRMAVRASRADAPERQLAADLRAEQPNISLIVERLRGTRFRPEAARRILEASRRANAPDWLSVLSEEAKTLPLDRAGHALLLSYMLEASGDALASSAAGGEGAAEGRPLLRAFAAPGRVAPPRRGGVGPARAEAILRTLAWYIDVFDQKYGRAALLDALAVRAVTPDLRDRLLDVLQAYRRPTSLHPLKTTECPVCLEEVSPGEDVGLACAHALHLTCARGLLKLQCPMCRGPFAGPNLRLTEREIEALRKRRKEAQELRAQEQTNEFLAAEITALLYRVFGRFPWNI